MTKFHFLKLPSCPTVINVAAGNSDIPDLPAKHPLVEPIGAGAKKMKKAVQINNICVAYPKLASAVSNQALKCFKKSCDTDYPNGKASDHYVNLKKKKFGQKMGYSGMILKALLAKVKWSKKEGGSVKFFKDITAIQLLQQQIKSNVLNESDYVLHLIKVVPGKYKTDLKPLLKKRMSLKKPWRIIMISSTREMLSWTQMRTLTTKTKLL